MDLENELSTFESSLGEDKNVTSVPHFDDETKDTTGISITKGTNGVSYAKELENKKNVLKVEPDQLSNSTSSPKSTIKKGHGLRKWRRIRRDFVPDSSPNIDSSKTMKRALPGFVNSMQPLHNMSVEARQMSEGSVGSVNMPTKNFNNGSSSDAKLPIGSIFTGGTDSESSKSSTAASAPKLRYDTTAQNKNKVKNFSGNGILGNSPQMNQHGKARIETTTKKTKGERVNNKDNESSHSSVESDSRSSNFVFMQGGFSSNGKLPSEKATRYDGENSDEEEARASEQQQYSKEHVEEIENLSDDLAANMSSWKSKQENSENHRSTTDNDPLVTSILTLQSVQEALEKELQKFTEIGKDHAFASTESEIHLGGFGELGSENIEQSASSSLETEVISLTHKVSSLEVKLDEASTMLKEKEARISELESILNKSPNAENLEEIEKLDLEGIFMKKIEAEVEYMIFIETINSLEIVANDHIALFKEQQTLAEEQEKMLNKLEETEIKATTLKKQAEALETHCEEILEIEDAVILQNKVSKVTACFFLQLILLALFFWVVVLELFSPKPGVVVPT